MSNKISLELLKQSAVEKQLKYTNEVRQIISAFIKETRPVSGTIDETVMRTLFNDGWDHTADCNSFNTTSLNLIKLLSTPGVDDLIGSDAPALKSRAIDMLLRFVPLFEELQNVDSKARLDLAFLKAAGSIDDAARFENEYRTKLALASLEKEMEMEYPVV